MKCLELFSGLGGLAKGLELAGFEHVMLVESNHIACNSLRANFNPDLVFEGDIRNFSPSFPQIDLVAGGPPCQPFSLGGKGKAHNDSRDMFPEALRVISKYMPKAFIFENVKGLLRKNFSEYFSYILLRLQFPAEPTGNEWQENFKHLHSIDKKHYNNVTYNIYFKLLNAADYGIPQIRERVFIIGIRSDLNANWAFPLPTHSKKRLLEDKHTGAYWKKHNINYNTQTVLQQNIRSKIFPWITVRDILQYIPEPSYECSFAKDHILKEGAKIYTGHTGSELDMPAKTIKAGGHGVPGGENMIRYPDGRVRYMTTFEAKIFQTFPPDYIVTGSWGESLRQIGNAVPVQLAEILGKKMFSLLKNL